MDLPRYPKDPEFHVPQQGLGDTSIWAKVRPPWWDHSRSPRDRTGCPSREPPPHPRPTTSSRLPSALPGIWWPAEPPTPRRSPPRNSRQRRTLSCAHCSLQRPSPGRLRHILGRRGLSHPALLYMWTPFAGGTALGWGRSRGVAVGLALNTST